MKPNDSYQKNYIHLECTNKVHTFTWMISHHSTQYRGRAIFTLQL